MTEPPPRTIQEAAALLGVSAHTLRYYDRENLLDVPRTGSGERRYSDHELGLLRLLLRLRRTGMGMGGLREYTRLLRLGHASIPDRRALLVTHEQDVAARLEAVQADLHAIREKIAVYDRLHPEPGSAAPGATSSSPEFA